MRRNLDYDADESIGSFYNTHRAIADAYDFQSELTKKDFSKETLGSELIKPSLDDYSGIEQSTPELPFARTEPNIRNLSVQNERVRC